MKRPIRDASHRDRGRDGYRVIRPGRAVTVALVVLSPVVARTSTAGATARIAPFTSSVAPVTTAQLGGTWHPGCPVGAATLRTVTLSYVGFDGRAHRGQVVVAASVTAAMVAVFRTLYLAHFPIRMMRPESAFGGSDPASMDADNTSGFNCRLAVGAPTRSWSVHAFGEAIDVDPVENPYLTGGAADPVRGTPFLRRSPIRPGMAVRGGTLVKAFAAVGWQWGGRWQGSPDYQHFSLTGG